jgi:hypothetical protein
VRKEAGDEQAGAKGACEGDDKGEEGTNWFE